MNVLMITTEWPTPNQPYRVPFLKRQMELLQLRGIEVKVFHFEGKKNPLNYLRAYYAVRKLVRTGNFAIIHAQWGQSALPAWGTGLPLVISFRGSDLYGITNANGAYSWKGVILRSISRFMARRANHLILVSASMMSKLPGIDLGKISILPTGINLNLFKPMPKHVCREHLGLARDKKIVFFGGDPERADKRFFLAQQAVQILQRMYPVELLIAKDKPQNQMPYYINAADVIVLTSKHEGSPNIVKEAIACNRPVVSVDVGDVKERVASIPGCKVTADTPQALANSLAEVLSSNEPFESRHTVLDLDENILIDKVIAIYRKACS